MLVNLGHEGPNQAEILCLCSSECSTVEVKTQLGQRFQDGCAFLGPVRSGANSEAGISFSMRKTASATEPHPASAHHCTEGFRSTFFKRAGPASDVERRRKRCGAGNVHLHERILLPRLRFADRSWGVLTECIHSNGDGWLQPSRPLWTQGFDGALEK